MGIVQILNNRNKVLGMNKRNTFYIRKFNKDKAKEIADNKVLTKQILEKHEIPTPKLIALIKDTRQLREFDWDSLPNSFVIKPVFGLEGGGIDIFYNKSKGGMWIRADGSHASIPQLKQHCSEILNGRYSLSEEPDMVMFEERVQNHKSFKYYTYKGTPDIRIIVFNNIPIMAMLRLPTKESEGKANLALGAIGAGIDIARGVTTTAIHGKNGPVEQIPGTKLPTSGLRIPWWNSMLKIAIEAQKVTNLDFAAIDFLIDKDKGPVIVELNARAGMSIQLANADGLRWRLRKAIGLKVTSTEKGVRLGKDLFGGEIESEIEKLSGKEVIGIYENVTLFGKHMEKESTKAKIDTGADSTSIDKALAAKLGFTEILELIKVLPEEINTREEGIALEKKYNNEYVDKYEDIAEFHLVKSSHGFSIRPYVNISIKIQDTQIDTKASIFDRSKLTYPVIIGRKSLNQFIVDPSKIR